jgi:periplasmic protein TonB
MWCLTRSLWYAGAFSCAFHILLLGLAASASVALPTHPVTQVRVTLLQRAVPLPIQDLPKGGKEAKTVPAPQLPPPQVPQPKRITPRSVTEKKPASLIPPRPPKRIAKPKDIPPPEPPQVVKEEPQQVALATPPAPVVPVQEDDPALASEQTTTVSEEARNPDALTGVGANGAPHLAGRNGGGGHSGGTQGVGGLSATPDYNVNPKPPYPLIARRIGAQGEVLLRVLVRPDGSVATVELARSSGFSLLDESATRTVRENWRFIPARHDGTPVESWVEVPIKFVLADS